MHSMSCSVFFSFKELCQQVNQVLSSHHWIRLILRSIQKRVFEPCILTVDSNIDKLLQLPTEWEWHLDILQNCDKLRPAIQDVAFPGHLIALHDKESEETQLVKLNSILV